jgi:bacilliredoxin
MYPEEFVRPMREELTRLGFLDLRTPEQVDAVLGQSQGTVLVVVNSICGCAAGRARPAVAQSLDSAARPDVLATVFAGQERDAAERARSYFTGHEPSSPSIALLREGKLLFMLDRSDIEGQDPFVIAETLSGAYQRFCASTTMAAETPTPS